MSAIKKFFQKKKMDFKFKKAGEGHRLDQPSQKPHLVQRSTSNPGSSGSGSQPPISPRGDAVMSQEKRRAAEAALSRMEQKDRQSKQGWGFLTKDTINYGIILCFGHI